jgi:hypothetical protein
LLGDQFKRIDYISFKLFGRTFYYLKGVVLYVLLQKPTAVISTGIDVHPIHILILYFVFRIICRKQFFWWLHGSFGNHGKFGIWKRKKLNSLSSGVIVYSIASFRKAL